MPTSSALHLEFERLWLRSQYAEALRLAQEELSLAQSVTLEHPDVVRALLDVAMALKATGHPEESLTFHEKAVRLRERLHEWACENPNDLLTADILLYEADQEWLELGDHPEVRQRLQEAQVIRTHALGEKDSAVAEVLARRAELAFVAGSLEEAEPLYRKAIVIFEQTKAVETAYFRKSLQGLAQVLAGFGRDEEAAALFGRAISLTLPYPQEKQALYFLKIYYSECLARLGDNEGADKARQEAESLLPKNNPGAQGFNSSGM